MEVLSRSLSWPRTGALLGGVIWWDLMGSWSLRNGQKVSAPVLAFRFGQEDCLGTQQAGRKNPLNELQHIIWGKGLDTAVGQLDRKRRENIKDPQLYGVQFFESVKWSQLWPSV